ncbi:acetyltransferase [Sedimenticola sp.]|uniref:acetyltransferase n=1 Tax=Sedimenticola sp. TaxID=1940285 RepID=UPI003D132FF5
MSASAALPVVLIGAGGHAKVVLSTARAAGMRFHGVVAPELCGAVQNEWLGLPILGDDTILQKLDPDQYSVLIGIGSIPGVSVRQEICDKLMGLGFDIPVLVHPAAWVDSSVTLERGVQIMAGAVVQPGSMIGQNAIINTHATVDHDCAIGRQVHIAPGATVCGGVSIGEGSIVGAGATIIHALSLGENTIVGANATVLNSFHGNAVLVGTPARPVSQKNA